MNQNLIFVHILVTKMNKILVTHMLTLLIYSIISFNWDLLFLYKELSGNTLMFVQNNIDVLLKFIELLCYQIFLKL